MYAKEIRGVSDVVRMSGMCVCVCCVRWYGESSGETCMAYDRGMQDTYASKFPTVGT